MEGAGNAPGAKRLNVLTLDGGGVRGISTLLILRNLMLQINVSLRNLRGPQEPHSDVEPHEIFDLVAGTSTGGLIAVMLGKLGMTIDQCIEAYRDLSRTIFGTKHIRGRLTRGLAKPRYSGSRLRRAVRKLLGDRGFDPELPMTYVPGMDKIACAVVCREHETEFRYSEFKSDAAPICSLPCPNMLECLVHEAARATAAAPTYFPVQKIAGRCFVDGGLEFNNPSFAIFDHYSQVGRVAEARRTSVAEQADLILPHHGNLDFTRIRIVNLGTGTKPPGANGNRPGIAAKLTPHMFRMAAFLSKTLAQMAVNSENTARNMESLARVSRNTGSCDVYYSRFSANNGVCYIELDKYKEVERITALTQDYLASPEIQQQLQHLAEEIAEDFLEAQSSVLPTALAVPNQRSPEVLPPAIQQSHASTSQILRGPESDTTQPPDISRILPTGDSSASDSTAATELSPELIPAPHTPTLRIPARQSLDISGAADSMIIATHASGTVAPVRS